eukprot:m.77082 g.77082  ORF g.77082 m.77082 type:complete len:519 (-) comp12600_c1_seq3:908-2464(-)
MADGYLECQKIDSIMDSTGVGNPSIQADDPNDVGESRSPSPQVGGPGERHKTLGVLPLVALIFFEVAGTPAGSENAVKAGGAFWALVGFAVMPFIWSVQEALITAELSTMFPEDAGYVQWVAAAFGELAGFMEGGMSWLSTAVDTAVYPVLMTGYLAGSIETLDQSQLGQKIVFFSIVCILSFLNYLGLQVVGRIAMTLLGVCLIPFLVFTFMSIPDMNVTKLSEKRPTDEIDWGLYLNTLFWNLNYFDSAGTFAGEVRNPKKVFPRALSISVVLVMFVYIVPLIAGIGISKNSTKTWTDSSYEQLSFEVGGRWLQGSIVFSIGMACAGMFLADMSANSFQLLGMADRGMIPKIFGVRSRFGTPTIGILLNMSMALLALFFELSELIEMMNVVYIWTVLLEISSFLLLRYKKPKMDRPYKVPLSLPAVSLLLTPTVVFSLIVMRFSAWQSHVFAVIGAVCTLAFGKLSQKCREKYPHYFNLEMLNKDEKEQLPERTFSTEDVHAVLLQHEDEDEDDAT